MLNLLRGQKCADVVMVVINCSCSCSYIPIQVLELALLTQSKDVPPNHGNRHGSAGNFSLKLNMN